MTLNIIATSLLFLTPFLSGLVVGFFSPKSPKKLKLLLSFSGAYLLALCFLHLIPEVYAVDKTNAGLFILLGFVIQLLLEFLSGGIEHGHFHFHSKNEKNFPIALMASLCVHTFLECLPLADVGSLHHHGGNLNAGFSLVGGILLHKIPVSVTLMTILIQSGISKKAVYFSLTAFSLTGPAGMIFGWYFSKQLLAFAPHFYEMSMAIVIGIFLHVSTTILFESGEGHRFNLLKLATILAGSLLAFATL